MIRRTRNPTTRRLHLRCMDIAYTRPASFASILQKNSATLPRGAHNLAVAFQRTYHVAACLRRPGLPRQRVNLPASLAVKHPAHRLRPSGRVVLAVAVHRTHTHLPAHPSAPFFCARVVICGSDGDIALHAVRSREPVRGCIYVRYGFTYFRVDHSLLSPGSRRKRWRRALACLSQL
ncbi:hypothetical protein MSAN_00594500 [Mycena sanguinolenta]|uniref:Uncharacterized protein n=1 Tax=Mycena sanguinolenta TaxID=230812 RepID=A0A8H7DHX7_9AGAR|nr:hypothetical protein MSAN_00594500 [Mycena sanguinolenta]